MTINRNNYEEYFLLYIDRELGDAERQMVEDFVRRHPDLEKELAALRQTVVLPPDLVFEHKEALLRDEKERRLFPLYLWRIAAALLIVLAGGWFLMMAGKTGKQDQPPADSLKIAVKKDAKHVKPSTELKTENRESSASAKKTYADFPRSRTLRKTGVPVIRQQPGSDLLSPDSNPVQQKLIAAKQNHRNPAETTNPHPAGDFPQTAATANQDNRQPSMDLPEIARNEMLSGTTIPQSDQTGKSEILNPSTINPPSPDSDERSAFSKGSGGKGQPPSTINDQPSTAQSILVFDSKNKTVSGFFKKLLSGPPEDAVADNHRKRVSVSVFQFNLKK
ncbi:MAG: hypothetical protein Q8939_08180 [Bacteroidota bacterium]|nr:hypothetical protein [Bacteroidota bacterium]MDP4214020.1 hypothetical protein [Bacteroidota bacterium]